MLIWNVLLTLAVGYLLIFGIGNKSADSSNDVLSDSTFKDHKQFRIAYFIMDSVAAHFGLVKQVKDELSNKEDAITAELDQMNKNIQNKYVYYQNKAQAGTLTQAESDAAGKELKKLDDDMKARQKKLDQDYFDLRTRKETEIKDKIEAFCKIFDPAPYIALATFESFIRTCFPLCPERAVPIIKTTLPSIGVSTIKFPSNSSTVLNGKF